MFYVANKQTLVDFVKKGVAKGTLLTCLAGGMFGLWNFVKFVYDHEDFKKKPGLIKVLSMTGQTRSAREVLKGMNLKVDKRTAELEKLIHSYEMRDSFLEAVKREDYIEAKKILEELSNYDSDLAKEVAPQLIRIEPDSVVARAVDGGEIDVDALWRAHSIYEEIDGTENPAEHHLIAYYIDHETMPVKEKLVTLFKLTFGKYDEESDSKHLVGFFVDNYERFDGLRKRKCDLLDMVLEYAGDNPKDRVKVANAYVKRSAGRCDWWMIINDLVKAKGIYDALDDNIMDQEGYASEFDRSIKKIIVSHAGQDALLEAIEDKLGIDAEHLYVNTLIDASTEENSEKYLDRALAYLNQKGSFTQEQRNVYKKRIAELYVRHFAINALNRMEKEEAYAFATRARHLYSEMGLGFDHDKATNQFVEELVKMIGGFRTDESASKKTGD